MRRSSYTEAMSPDNKWIRLMKSAETADKLTQKLADAAVERIDIHEGGVIELTVKYHDIYELTGKYIGQLRNEAE